MMDYTSGNVNAACGTAPAPKEVTASYLRSTKDRVNYSIKLRSSPIVRPAIVDNCESLFNKIVIPQLYSLGEGLEPFGTMFASRDVRVNLEGLKHICMYISQRSHHCLTTGSFKILHDLGNGGSLDTKMSRTLTYLPWHSLHSIGLQRCYFQKYSGES